MLFNAAFYIATVAHDLMFIAVSFFATFSFKKSLTLS